MKIQALFIIFLLGTSAAKAQDGVIKIQVTDDLRKKFAAEARQPDPSQIVSVTPPELLKQSNPELKQADASQIVTETPPSLRKRAFSLPPVNAPAGGTAVPEKQ